MNNDVQSFLESGLLESYLMGTCNKDELSRVEYFIEKFPEVKNEYDTLQDNIEKMAYDLEIKPPAGLKEAIISCIEDDCKYKPKTNFTRPRQSIFPNYIPWAAAFMGIVMAVTLWINNVTLNNRNQALSILSIELEQQIKDQAYDLAFLEEKLSLSGHTLTNRVILTGNNLAPEFSTTAFWNDTQGKAILYINGLDSLEQEKCYQMWADVNGEMINLGVIPNKTGVIEIKFLENAESLNVTIEPQGGSQHPTVSQIVSSRSLKSM